MLQQIPAGWEQTLNNNGNGGGGGGGSDWRPSGHAAGNAGGGRGPQSAAGAPREASEYSSYGRAGYAMPLSAGGLGDFAMICVGMEHGHDAFWDPGSDVIQFEHSGSYQERKGCVWAAPQQIIAVSEPHG